MISLLLFFLAGCARGIAELVGYEHHDSIFSGTVPPESFWGSHQWKRKYRLSRYGSYFAVPWPKMGRLHKRYYDLFKIRYRERFLFSTTALVWLTDGMHLCNFLMKFFLIGACLTSSWGRENDLIMVIIAYIIVWTTGFNLTYSFIFQRKLR